MNSHILGWPSTQLCTTTDSPSSSIVPTIVTLVVNSAAHTTAVIAGDPVIFTVEEPQSCSSGHREDNTQKMLGLTTIILGIFLIVSVICACKRWTMACGGFFIYMSRRDTFTPRATPHDYPISNAQPWLYGKTAFITTAVLFAITGAVLSGVGASDSDACINLKATSIFGTIYTGIGILLAALASYPL